jgi:putative acetyltransferase
MALRIVVDDLAGDAIARFLEAHIRDMRSVSPPESKHALDLEGLRRPNITFWSIMDGEAIVGCGALKEIDAQHGELKSMRTAASHRGQGIGALMLQHIIDEGRRRSYRRLFLETGAMPFFAPARRLYARFGFVSCAPFADYKEDPNSVFMTLAL